MGLLNSFLSILLMEKPNEECYERELPALSYRNFMPDPRILDGRKKLKPSMKYIRDLQYCYMELLDYLGQNSLFDVASIREQYNFLHSHACDLERMLQKTIGEKDALQARLDLALEWQTASGKKNEVLTENGYAPVEEKTQPRDGTKFASVDGLGFESKLKMIAAMIAYDIDRDEIAKELHIKRSTIESYYSQAKGNFFTGFADGKNYIHFQGKLGNDSWCLDDMFGKLYKYEDGQNGNREQYRGETTLPNSDMGVISHGLQKPVY